MLYKKLCFIIIFFCNAISSTAQISNIEIDSLFNSRIEYVMNIPEKFQPYYKNLIDFGNPFVLDTLKKVILSKNFLVDSLYFVESQGYPFETKRGKIWSKDFIISYRWNDSEKEIEIESNDLYTSFNDDIEKWNEYVTNRSYFYWDGAGGGFYLCSKAIFKSGGIEIRHSAFKGYNKTDLFFYLKEQPEDDYTIRMQLNCNWLKEKKGKEEVVKFLIEYHKDKGSKIFDCAGNEL